MIPNELAALERLAFNLWWSWDTEATQLWASVDPYRWHRCRHNPVALLRDVEPERWAELASNPDFVRHLHAVEQRFDAYMAQAAPREADGICYLSMEFGLHESLRIYSGGLGVLAGDHVRSASDLALPLVGVGLLWREGYFRQVIDGGQQVAATLHADLRRLPLQDTGHQISVLIGDRHVAARVWRLDVGRIPLLLLDADVSTNHPQDRAITTQLYGGDADMRLRQEALLGLGASQAVHALGFEPRTWHLNEGHCAFLALSLLGEARSRGLALADAVTEVREHCVFTTHTPVPAGHDRFDAEHVEQVLGRQCAELGVPAHDLVELGREHPGGPLCMTVLALRCSRASNGVSELHGRVSRAMWRHLWPRRSENDVPIGHITNGVHPTFWAAPRTRALLDRYCPDWRDRPWDEDAWAGAAEIPDAELWELRNALRRELLEVVARRAGVELDPDALTIGFARRFAPYKRGDLIFSQPDRLEQILTGSHPVQIVYAGKAHPRDRRGQEIVASVVRWTESRQFRGRVVLVEDYDIELGRALTSGADVWLNNPRRPHEASGTSGQKVCLNGGLNLSTLDGWWVEGYDPAVGWVIGDDTVHPDPATQDAFDTEALYQALEKGVLPTWGDRDAQGHPTRWLDMARRCIADCGPAFNSTRMVKDYAQQLYA